MPVLLEKRVEAAVISLQKVAEKATEDLGDVSAQITLEVDASTSMTPFYRSDSTGVCVVQEIVERCLALSMTGLDVDKTVPVTFYADRAWDPFDVTDQDFHDLVEQWTRSNYLVPATNYAPAIRHALAVTGGKDETVLPPNLHIFVTDGQPSDRLQTETLLVEARTRPHFFQFVCVGTDPNARAYLDHLNNDLSGTGLDNVGVFYCPNPAGFSDEEFYDGIVNEFFPVWLPKARVAGYTK
jgi:hypothetical protein